MSACKTCGKKSYCQFSCSPYDTCEEYEESDNELTPTKKAAYKLHI